MKTRVVLAFICGLSFLQACKKTGAFTDTRFYGKVIDADTRQPIEGMKVQLEFLDGDGGMGLNLGSYTVAEMATDANGNYSFGLNANDNNSGNDRYRLTGWSPDTYFGFGAEPSCKDADRKATQLNFECYKKMVATVNVIHDGPQNSADYIHIEADQEHGGQRIEDLVYDSQAKYDVILEIVPDYPVVLKYQIMHNGVRSAEQTTTVTFSQNRQSYDIHY